jgi:signal transduction histidine kinase
VRAAAALSAAVFVAVALAAAGLALVLLQERSARASVEKQTRAHAAAAADLVAAGEDPVATVTAASSGFALLQVLDSRGALLAASPQLAGAPPLQSERAGVPDTVDDAADAVVDDGPLLVVEQEVGTPFGSRVVLAAGSLAAAESSSEAVSQLVVIGVPLLAAVAGAAIYAFTGRALRPVEAIRAQVAALSDRDLSRRVPQPFARDEIGRLARTMNDMLARLESAQSAQRRFVADASHELRSPLATIIGRLELGMQRGPSRVDLTVMTPEAQRMAQLVDDLLLLARADERGLVPQRDDVDLDELVEVEGRRLRSEGHLQLRVHALPVRVTGDRAQLARVLRNLADNAARHASELVTFDVDTVGSEAVLRVGDDGPGIPADDRLRVFQRFVRLDDGRAREAGGCGLGLSIVAEVVAAHSGHVEIRSAEGGGALVEVRLPGQQLPGS